MPGDREPPAGSAPYAVPADDPLAAAHEAVAAWVDDAIQSGVGDLELRALPSGRRLLDADPTQACRTVLAAVAQMQHWNRVIATGTAASEHAWIRRWYANSVARVLIRRKLPFTGSELTTIVTAYARPDNDRAIEHPVGAVVRAVERHAAAGTIEEPLRAALRDYAAILRRTFDNDGRRHAVTVDRLCAEPAPAVDEQPVPAASRPSRPAPRPASAGSPAVFRELKIHLGMLPGPCPPSSPPGPLAVPVDDDSPLRREHALLDSWLATVPDSHPEHDDYLARLFASPEFLGLDPPTRGRAALAAAERARHARANDLGGWPHWAAAQATRLKLLSGPWSLDRAGLFDMLLVSVADAADRLPLPAPVREQLTADVLRSLAAEPATEGERYLLARYRQTRIAGLPLGTPPDDVVALTEAIGDGTSLFLVPGEVWSDAVNAQLTSLPAADQRDWVNLLQHVQTPTPARPRAKWLDAAKRLVATVGPARVHASLAGWLPLVDAGRSLAPIPTYPGDPRARLTFLDADNSACLTGLLRCLPLLPDREALSRHVTAIAVHAYEKHGGMGPRAVAVGNAAVHALAEMPSHDTIAQLARLRTRVRTGVARNEIEKAFQRVAAALNLPRDQIEEIGIPTAGLDEPGRGSHPVGDCRVELLVTATDVEVRWHDAAGRRLKAAPARLRRDHGEALGEVRRTAADLRAALAAQRQRLEGLFLGRRSWPLAEWRDRYLDHPLVGTIARRLLWCIDGEPATFHDGLPLDVHGATLAPGRHAEVSLWHPVDRSRDEVRDWRRRLEELRIRQPFKQAHREVYLLTDAERATRTYSNRFAAHVIRQHQFHALCGVRGWRNALRLMADGTAPPACRGVPAWGLEAEFWVTGCGDVPGVDTAGSGVYLRLSTDQVRFRRTAGTAAPNRPARDGPVPLEELPTLVFSEIMRDIDLFVGVGSIGNDPTWRDGGPGARYRSYWQAYAFGELSAGAATRKEVLERLVPRMRIASRCSFEERFLVVRGDRRTYRIHLGSGNILMEPNDQYLCIVADATAAPVPDDLFLPFDGDATLSLIISKALLLADDTRITDPTITRQIDRA